MEVIAIYTLLTKEYVIKYYKVMGVGNYRKSQKISQKVWFEFYDKGINVLPPLTESRD